MRLLYIFFFCYIVIGCGHGTRHGTTSEKRQHTDMESNPNVIVILIDDAGYVDFGFMGSEDIQTPEIDKLAKSGVIFTDAHVSATVCAPSRAGLITGKYQQRYGFEANGTGDEHSGSIGLSDRVTTLATQFQKNGYRTIALGKWHLGSEPSDHPNQRGFDEFYGFLAGSRSYFPIEEPSWLKMLQHNGKRIIFNGYLTDVLGERSVAYVTENRNQPFFMYLAYNAVHTPMEAKEDDLKKFKNHPRQKLAAMTWSLDQNIGKLLHELKILGLRENTLIYFLSDNGGAHNNDSKMGSLKGWKGNEFEGGHRVPFVVSWPKEIKGNRKFEKLTSSLDIFPTAMAAAGIDTPDDLNGVNLLPYLTGEKDGPPHEKLFWRKLEESAARIGNYKLIQLKNFGAVLYNLENDLGETTTIHLEEKEMFDTIINAYRDWETQLIQPLWVEGKNWMDVSRHVHESLMQNKEPLYKNPWSKAFKTRKQD